MRVVVALPRRINPTICWHEACEFYVFSGSWNSEIEFVLCNI